MIRWIVSEKLPQNKGNKRKIRNKRKKSQDGHGTTDDETDNIDEIDDEDDETDMFQSNLTGRALLEKTIHDNVRLWINKKYTKLKPSNNITQFRSVNIDFPNQSEQGIQNIYISLNNLF